MADGIGNSLLLVNFPLYVRKESISVGLPLPLVVGFLISVYGFSAAVIQPIMRTLSDRGFLSLVFVELPFIIIGVLALIAAIIVWIFIPGMVAGKADRN
jgi:MFS family permease